jgi:hypothetical protein
VVGGQLGGDLGGQVAVDDGGFREDPVAHWTAPRRPFPAPALGEGGGQEGAELEGLDVTALQADAGVLERLVCAGVPEDGLLDEGPGQGLAALHALLGHREGEVGAAGDGGEVCVDLLRERRPPAAGGGEGQGPALERRESPLPLADRVLLYRRSI